ncbi:hypothetical protein GGR53DRAFT_463473 [Hypoxylon sp. FL1150]|nr:hypothetical protein GGR53DRAFT_463473 [Hypoxylon sp. FL1150]
MDPTDHAMRDGSPDSPPEQSPTGEKEDERSAPKKAVVRKRTKTGCLTCRKRRIKCDEGRPTCNNCLKSKRQCEGYHQRVIFKDPLSAYSSNPFGPNPIQYSAPPPTLVRELTAAQKSSSQALQFIAPKPPPLGYHQPGAHFYAGQAGQTTSPPLNFNDPNGFVSPPAPSKFTFFPPTTADAFSHPQHQWRQNTSPDFNQFTPLASEDFTPSISPAQQQQPLLHQLVHAQFDKGKAPAMPEEPVQDTVPSIEEFEFLASEDEYMYEYDDDTQIGEQHGEMEFNEHGLAAFQRINQPLDMFGTETRTFSAFAPESLLATYEPSVSNSPLNDPQIAAVFWHFVNVTGPSISLYERHPQQDPSPRYGGQAIPKVRQNIWTYTFPIQSFKHPALLHAILAIASLQIAKLQQVPPTVSLKHYHIALRRIAGNVGRPYRRAQPSNLAATLMLAFYEVWSSDHDKWSRHLFGARLIIKEIPFAQMTRDMMAIKMRKRLEDMQNSAIDPFDMFLPHEESGPLHKDWDQINVQLLSAITGRDLSYEELGMVPEAQGRPRRSSYTYTSKDMERYEQLTDLFWWYCKMDVYQSILGGTRLFLEYNVWTQCPPRAPVGQLDAIYGTYDHLMLLLGRLSDFASRDLSRKRAVFKANPGRGASPGMFPGMVPRHPEKFVYPRGFTPPRDEPPPVPARPDDHDDNEMPGDTDLDASTAAAHREWEGIRRAFETLRSQFGAQFEPLGIDVHPARPTPFGLAAHYRTYSIAGIWMNYYMGLIVLHRAHPAMPPIAMVAAGLSARNTAGYCLEVGRIAAGLEENIAKLTNVTTLMAAALIECCFPLFVAGIQYRDDPQRQWLIRRLHDIARLTGWQSARQIAVGCETSWTKAAELGRGPPYTRSAGPYGVVDPPGSVWVNARRLDRLIQEVEDDGSKIVLAKAEKAYYAMGLLALEQDLEKLDLEAGELEAK